MTNITTDIETKEVKLDVDLLGTFVDYKEKTYVIVEVFPKAIHIKNLEEPFDSFIVNKADILGETK